jgi:hypothetical protein
MTNFPVGLMWQVIESLEKLKASEKWITQGGATLVVFTIIGLVMTIVALSLGDPIFSNIALLNIFLGLAVGVPLIYVGKATLDLRKSESEIRDQRSQVRGER